MNSENISNDEKLKKIKSKNDFDELKSNYILKQIFNIMKKNKSFEIMKYNKNLQKRLNLHIYDYKIYSQILSPIEIELKLENNKYGKFINIRDNEKKYYHIYFDNSKKEIKRNYLLENEKVKTIKIMIDYQIKSLEKLFRDCKCIKSIFFKKFLRINIYNMNRMFYGCSSLK